jgi:hypothetical protein
VIARAAVVVLLLLLVPASARAAPNDCPELPCSVIRNCSSTGVACDPNDRDCAEKARERDLEVKCEQECTSGKRLVYCPLDAGRSDSNVVWILLAVATLLAVVGGTVGVVVLKSKKS